MSRMRGVASTGLYVAVSVVIGPMRLRRMRRVLIRRNVRESAVSGRARVSRALPRCVRRLDVNRCGVAAMTIAAAVAVRYACVWEVGR